MASHVVVGGGVNGLSVACRLAERGADVVLLDKGRVGGGATGSAGGIVRNYYRAEDRGWVALSAISDLVLGILILALPDLSLATLAVLFGISLVLRGVFALVAAFKLRKVHKEDADPAPPFGAAPA